MRRSSGNASIGFVIVFVVSVYAVGSLGCGAFDADGSLGLKACDIFNCDGLFFRNLADDHDEAGNAGGHDDQGDGQVAGVDDDDDVSDDHADEIGDGADVDGTDEHDGDADVQEEGHDDTTAEDDDGSGPGQS